ncbi:MAG: endonuclease/exonuclease/phosphatase family protein [Deltaproteobacteria bacterium]|nr:endonuclease/exonuclease/phosphatase family protein [Deltaproteobacteria bacterium]MBI3387099.1 endonuclease/exonuclease/phosphatase family protein [Deltaproteobacteria bacterium]
MAVLLYLRLVTWNLHGPPFAPRRRARMGAAAMEIARRAPDLALLQEVWFPGDAAYLVDQLRSDYDSIDVPAGALLGRKGGLLAFLRRSSPWSTERRVARFEEFGAAASRLIFWQGDGLGAKGIQIIELRHRDSSQRLFVLHTHLQAQYGEYRYEEIRHAQIAQLSEVAAGLDSAVPVLAAGDLNTMPEETVLYAQITGPWGDLTQKLRQRCGRGTVLHNEAVKENEWLDYVLAHHSPAWRFTAEVEAIRNTGVDDPFSDHDGLDAAIAIRTAVSPALD